MKKIFSYVNSHIYEIHAILAATIALVIVLFIQGYIKKWLSDFVEKRASKNIIWNANKEIYLKRCNGVILILMMLFSFIIFSLEALFSPFIVFSFWSGLLSGAFALTEYAVLKQLGLEV